MQNIPEELRSLRQWVCWNYEESETGKPTKVPKTIGGYNASSTDPADWYTFEDVCEVSQRFSGIGFVFTKDDPYCGLDLDDCLQDGELKEWAEEIATHFGGTYAEVSPSGNGIKYICRGQNPLDRGRKVAVGDGAVELYDSGRFFTITGNVYGSGDVVRKQPEIDWLVETHLGERANLAEPLAMALPQKTTDKVARASAYLATVDPAISGSGGHDTTFRAACALVIGFDLSQDEAYQLLATEYNPRCVPPWSEKELRHKVKSADKQPGARGHLLAEQSFPSVDLSFIAPAIKKTADVPKKKPFPKECLKPPGILSEIIEYTLRKSMYPQPELALAGALALLATVTGRKVTDTFGTRTNAYILGLAPSGAGKEQARKTNKTLLSLAGCERFIGPERIASSAGLVVSIAEKRSILFQLDEIGRLLATMKRPEKSPHLYNIITVLMQVYSSSDTTWIGDAYADTKKVKTINQPHAVIYGTSVPESFWDSLTAENVSDGMLGRLMAFESTVGYVEPKTPEDVQPSQALIDSIRWWANYSPDGNIQNENPEPLRIEYSDVAAERLKEHKHNIYKRQKSDDPQVTALWMRSAEKASKLALLFAVSRSPMTPFFKVELEDVDRAIMAANYLTREVQRNVYDRVSDNEQEARTKRVLRLLDGGHLSKSELTRKTQWLRKRERDEILQTLIEAELVQWDTKPTGGRDMVVLKRI